MMMAARNTSGVTNQLAGDSTNSLTKNDEEAPSTRRKPSGRRQRAAGCSLSNSLRGDRNGGLASTKGRLSVSFSDQKGLSSAMIGDILSDFDDGDDEPEASMEDLLGVGPGDNKKGGGMPSMGRRMQLMTIQSQRSVTFNVDPKDLEDSDEE